MPGDDEETRRNKVLFTLGVILMIRPLLWGVMYFAFSEPVAALFPLSYSILTFADLALFFRLRRFDCCGGPDSDDPHSAVRLQLSLGGFAASSAVIVWSFLAVLMAVLFGGRGGTMVVRGFIVEMIRRRCSSRSAVLTTCRPGW